MVVEFDKSFSKSIDKINDAVTLRKIESLIIELEQVDSIVKIKNIKKLKGFKSYYRVRMGNYRIGLVLPNPQKVRLIIAAHRKDIYRTFP